MAQAGTLLSDLGSQPGGHDSDLVQQILADMNSSPPQQQAPQVQMQQAPPPPMGHRMPMQQAPPMQQSFPQASDPAVPTAHMIGHQHPTQADFNRMMMSSGPMPMNLQHMQQMQMMQLQQPQKKEEKEPASKNWQAEWADEFKIPILVAIVTLIVTLPAVNLLISHYAPRLLRPGGDLNTYGLIARSLLAGALFWFLQRVVAPLVIF
jgi:hypothetical protein